MSTCNFLRLDVGAIRSKIVKAASALRDKDEAAPRHWRSWLMTRAADSDAHFAICLT